MSTATTTNWTEAAQKLISDPRFGRHNLDCVFPHRVLIWSEATGTGKSTLPYRLLFGRNPVRVTLFAEMEVDSLVGPMQLRDGNTVCQPQLAAEAMAEGRPLILDEVDQFSASVETYLNAILDDYDLAVLTLPDGQKILPKDGFCVVGTTNARPETLPERLLHRFDAIIHADSPASGLLDSLPDELSTMLLNDRREAEKSHWAPMTTRRMIALDRFLQAGFDELDAIKLVFGPDDQAAKSTQMAIAANRAGCAK